MLTSARYRVGQVLSLLAARRQPPDEGPAVVVLPPPLLELFRRMPAEDRRHALRVLADLRSRGATAAPLLQAGLLHDLGKAGAGVGLLHRVSRVALRRLAPPLWRWLSASATGWRRPFWVVRHHPERGAAWAQAAGAEDAVVDLIRHHERPAPEAWQGSQLAAWHAELAWADARS